MSEHENSEQGNEEGLSQFKETIIEKAQKGLFSHNPLLSTIHIVICQKCKHRKSVVYLTFLKSGEFEFGKTEQVEILNPQGSIGFLETENITPIIFTLICEKCGCHIEVEPINVEYLKNVIDRPITTRIMYV